MSSKPPKKRLKRVDFSKIKSGSSTGKGKSAKDREIDKRLAGVISDADMKKLRSKAMKDSNKKGAKSVADNKKTLQMKKNQEMQKTRKERQKTLKELRGGK